MSEKPTYAELEKQVQALKKTQGALKKSEAALKDSEEKYRKSFESITDSITVTRIKDGQYLYVNDGFCHQTGYSRKEVLGETPSNISLYAKPAERDRFIGILKKHGKAEDVVVSFRRKNGEVYYSEFSAKPISYAGEDCLLAQSRDITKRKRAEEALRESEAQKAAILDGITTNLAFVNENLEVLWTNKTSADSVKRTMDEIIGHKCYELWADPETPCDGCPTVKAFKTRKTEQTIMRTPDGRVWDEKGEPVFDENGDIMGVLQIAHDVTEKIHAEEALRASEEKLARSKKMEAMGLMAGGIAHDLNNILSGIVSYPELLLMDLPEDSPLRKPIKTIQESGMRAADVVGDLLTIARGVASGKEVLNLNAVVEEYLNSAEHQKLEKIHPLSAFKTELDSELLNITGSASHVKKVLMNLIVNASEAIEGRGTVTVSTMNQPLKGYEDVRTGEYVVLTISDDGSGISPQDLDRIFEPFYTKKVMGRSGTGLGLAVVWNSMQDHDGYINVKSSEKGTIFELYFPTTREQVADERGQVSLEDYCGHGEKVLVVDDEERQREIASGILSRLGYN
ncbi:MAG: PAS domain S-box protein, partial [Deltaproteobacteria bacterium]|nr:PAS domain S-box protein [Deltaproteobacteria bacterium]